MSEIARFDNGQTPSQHSTGKKKRRKKRSQKPAGETHDLQHDAIREKSGGEQVRADSAQSATMRLEGDTVAQTQVDDVHKLHHQSLAIESVKTSATPSEERKAVESVTPTKQLLADLQLSSPRVRMHEDRRAINPVGKPGPKRRQQNERAMNPVGKPGPKRRKALLRRAEAQLSQRTTPIQLPAPKFAVRSAETRTPGSAEGSKLVEHKKETAEQPLSNREVTAAPPKHEMAAMSPPKPQIQDPGNAQHVTAPAIGETDDLPTPPESPAVRAIGEYVDATSQVKEWLKGQQSPTTERVSHVMPDDDDEDYVKHTAGSVDAPATVKKRPTKCKEPNLDRSEKAYLPEPITDGPTSGPFTDAEKAAADDVFEYIVQNDTGLMNAYSLKALTIDWTNVGLLKLEMQNALPCRTKAAVRKFCQRRYHAYEKGKWTEEQDALLRKAYAEHPDKWAVISDFVDRIPNDCRDRYRNIVQYGENLVNGPWSQEEEERLMTTVEASIDLIKKKSKNDAALVNDRALLEEMVSWNAVAAKIDGRSRKRCLEKWQQLKRRGTVCAISSAVTSAPAPAPAASMPFDGQSKKMRAIEAKFKTFEHGDYYDALCEIYTAIDDHAKVFHSDSTFWSVVAIANPGSKFNSALRRRVFHEILEGWGWKDKRTVRQAQTTAAKADAMATAIKAWAEKKGTELIRGFKPGVVVEPKPREKRKRIDTEPADGATLPKMSGNAKKYKSEEFVLDSDEEDDAVQPSEHGISQDVEQVSLDDEAAGAIADDLSSDANMKRESDIEIPETQQYDAHQTATAGDDATVSSVGSEYEPSLQKLKLGAQNFVQRCRAVGRQEQGGRKKERKRK